MTITNIYPADMIGPEMIRQEVEMYLPLQIEAHPEQYEFLAHDREKGIRSYKIVDTNVGDPQYSKGEACGLEKQIYAASLIKADEITLTDKIDMSTGTMRPTNKSIELSMEAYKDFMINYSADYGLNLGWVMQAEDRNKWNEVLDTVLQLDRISTILIPKWECYTTLWGEIKFGCNNGRHILSTWIRYREDVLGTKTHRIHWLGNGDGFKEYMKCPYEEPDYRIDGKCVDVTSTDSGLWIAQLIQTGSYDLYNPRPVGFEIDLHNSARKVEWFEVEKLIHDQKEQMNKFKKSEECRWCLV